ncbi:MAG: competence/damage-inducible protein A [Spirochaetaceae bacterium]|nr:MAG: competence/damage-inducible protein A [Spirochaetaceae bacterium]
MKAEIIAVGTELLLGHVINTNAAEIARMLAEIGIGVYHQTVVGDNEDRLARAITTAIERPDGIDLVILCGGLGPTEDDLTRETLAAVLGLPLERNAEWTQHLHELFEKRRRDLGHPGGSGSGADLRGNDLPRNNLRQAMVPKGATLLPNTRGSAPGIYLHQERLTFVLLPGPPEEMRGLMREEVIPRLARHLGQNGGEAVLVSRVLRVTGIGESRVAELLAPLLEGQTNPTIAPLAHPGEMHLRITAHASDRERALDLNEKVARRIYAVLGEAIYGEDEQTLEAVTGELLLKQGMTLALAESCTGGLLSHRLTNVPGSSRYLLGSIVAYSNGLKQSALAVPGELIAREGAVSAPVAEAMAQGALALCGSETALAITGIAGPGGGTEEKPVGLTFIALAEGEHLESHRYRFSGEREEVKRRAAQAALELLYRHLSQRP